MNAVASPPFPTVRVGLIGCGKMGLQHIRAISATRGRVVAVADPLADTGQIRATAPPDTEILTDVTDLLDRIRPDVVHIVTPPDTHASLARSALLAGCHVYVEKPFVPTRGEAADLLALARERNLSVCAGHQYLFERPSLLALEWLPRLGRLTHVESYFSFRTVRRTTTAAEQATDILPHAVYPLLAQLRAGTGLANAHFEVAGTDIRAEGDIFALIRLGSATGILMVTLNGRPVEQYQYLVGTNGALRADYITGSLLRLIGPGAGLGVLFTPYRRALQTAAGATRGFSRLIFGRKTSYPGLIVLLERFYESIQTGESSPLSPRSILDTVDVCEVLGRELEEAVRRSEAAARERVQAREGALHPAIRGLVLVTGGTGLLGRKVVEELRCAGFGVRAVSRRVPRWTSRVSGVEYAAADLSRPLDPDIMSGVTLVVHCAAETAGGQMDHERNSIAASRNVVEAAAKARVPAMIHISSLAVLKTGAETGGPLDENTPLDVGNLGRGPYVWGKAESEQLVRSLGAERGVDIKIVRPGPLVDYGAFQPPGRLGRELGPVFVAIGGKRSPLSVCDVGTAARVLRWYAERFDEAPRVLNLVEAPPPSRGELAARLGHDRPELRFLWIPSLMLRLASPLAGLAQRLLLGSAKPVDVYAAFASERYRTDLAESVISRAGSSCVPADGAQPVLSAPIKQ